MKEVRPLIPNEDAKLLGCVLQETPKPKKVSFITQVRIHGTAILIELDAKAVFSHMMTLKFEGGFAFQFYRHQFHRKVLQPKHRSSNC